MKKLFALTLLFFILVGISALNAQNFTVNDLTYSVNEDGVSVTLTGHVNGYGHNASGELIIPESVTYNGTNYTVTTIGDYAFYQYSQLTGYLVIPNSITSIGKYSFDYCTGFEGILTIGESVTIIDECAFMGCSGLTGYLNIPNSVITIGEGAFLHCTGFDQQLILGNSVTEIGTQAFANCSNLTGQLIIPNSVITIGQGAFSTCTKLTSLVIGSNVESIDDNAFFLDGDIKKVVSLAVIPPTIGDIFYDTFNMTLSVPRGCLNAYKNSDWNQYFVYIFEDLSSCLINTEWYYEINNENGMVTYQYLECDSDTTINDQPIHILVRINTLYDKQKSETITHEYVYEENNKVYWWNKELGEFTTLYDFGADEGDEWEIKVGNESITMHVDAVEPYDYEGQTLKLLRVSDANDIFSGEIVCGIGHLTSFFPEKLMTKGYRVENIRCFWQDGELVYQNGDQDCDEIYEQHHLGVDEIENEYGFVIYPNPSHDVLFVKTCHGASLQSDYRITNMIGQTIMTGKITSENQQIDISELTEGIYFIKIGDAIMKFLKKSF
ncbi:MAG: leucine-rich repeat domain-containing protein [Bacteroidales bacterium]|nr:leucine-rich repeat domain-containing protein [Bacteroidales bacterium]